MFLQDVSQRRQQAGNPQFLTLRSQPKLFSRPKLPLALKADPRPKTAIRNEDGVSIPGFQRIMRPTNTVCKRIVWSVAIGMCFIICVLLLQCRLTFFFDAPTILDSNPAWNRSVYFPAITLCPIQEPFDESSIYYSWLLELAKMRNTTGNVSDYESVPFDDLNFTLIDVWNGYAIPDDRIRIIASCGIVDGNRICNYQEGVRTTLKNDTYETLWGQCRLFIPEMPYDYRGPATFLMIGLNGSQHDKVHNATGIKYTAKYILHDRETTHRHDAYMLSSCISTGWQNAVKLIVKEFHFLNTSRNICDTADHVISCSDNYVDNILTESLNCSLPFIKNKLLPACKSWRDADEAYHKTKKIYNSLTYENYDCRHRCQETVYINFVGKIKLHKEMEETTYLSLEFADNNFENVTEVYVYTLPSLLSDIAAFLGFFLGICILSVFELLESAFAKIMKWQKKT